jgi:geranylgeranyl pyrophosphate synthase
LETHTFYSPIKENINLVEARMRSVADGYHPDLKAALDHLLSSGGKRIRPAVSLLTGRMLGADPDRLVTLAAAIELLHTATLVHDDLIDGALLRRGIPTLNSSWSPASTILTGDFIFACAAKLAAQTNSVEVMQLFAETLSTIVNGEITQMFGLTKKAYYEDYLTRIYAKTASLFELATTAAAMLSLNGESISEVAKQFGYGIGIAFQIVDDVLDFTGQTDTIGKPVANDLRQGLVTLPTIYYFEEQSEHTDIYMMLNEIRFNEEKLKQLSEAISHSPAIERSLQTANEFINLAQKALSNFPDNPERQALQDLANYIIARTK